jgi:uncharacterized protein
MLWLDCRFPQKISFKYFCMELAKECSSPLFPEKNVFMNVASNYQTLRDQIHAAAELLPSQGPITAFAFLNPLQGLESLPFDEAMRKVKRIFDCEPYLEESRYLAKLRRGRITVEDLRAVLADDLGARAKKLVANLIQIEEFQLGLLTHSIHCGVDRELDWLLAESNALQVFRDGVPDATAKSLVYSTRVYVEEFFASDENSTKNDSAAHAGVLLRSVIGEEPLNTVKRWGEAKWESVTLQLLWRIASDGIQRAFQSTSPPMPIRHRDLVRTQSNIDCDQWVHDILVRFCAAYLDQGFAAWKLPSREKGFFQAFCEHHQQSKILNRRWCRELPKEARRIQESGMSPLDSIEESLELLGVGLDERVDFIQSTLLALRGYSGMLWQTEIRPDRVQFSSPPGTLVEYLAVRLILDRLAFGHVMLRHYRFQENLASARKFLISKIALQPEVTAEQQAYIVFQMAQLSGWTPKRLSQLSHSDWGELSAALHRFSSYERRRVYQVAFERQLMNRSLDAITLRAAQPAIRPASPRLQIVCCIDAREESFRRHLEELDDGIETFGMAGFFGVPMYYRGAADAHFASQAPIVIKPKHWVSEEVVYSFEDADLNRARARRVIGSTSRRLHIGARGSLAGAIVSTLLGPLATAPLLSRVLFPRFTGALNRTARKFVAPPAVTRLHLERSIDTEPSNADDGLGFTIPEMARMAEQALRDIGLTSRFAKLVIFMGHGSSCVNNPHESAYHCGACSGSPGGPNARALAAMLNDLRVRRILSSSGIHIPEGTFFLGGLHNTATEELAFFDLELLPSSQIAGLRWAKQNLEQAAERNAHERCRRFESAPLDIKPTEALLHVQGRAEDLAQTRPEYGNCTNALCFIGRRSRIRGLFLDRRSFLMSYDPTGDDEQATVLSRILSAVVPVCEGINSLYSLSAIDNIGWGSGTKLPHNVTSLLGVMDGAASDLRTGLPWQGLDIHEPVRLLFIIESKPEPLIRIIDSNPTLMRIFRNQWSHAAILDPESENIQRFKDDQFIPHSKQSDRLPEVASSQEWYQGKRDHLSFASVVKV